MMGSESSAAKSAPYFVSSLSSKSVPENGEVAFSCKITGNPKPDITWCKNGKDIKELEDFSNLEIMEDNLIHTLRLFCCTEQHAGVYRIVASNCFGRVQSSAFLKVTAGAKPDIYKTSHDRPQNNTRTCRASDVTTHHWESSNQAIGNNEDLEEKNDSIHEGFFSLESSEPPASELNVLSTDQTLFFYLPEYGFCPSMENQPKHTHCLEDSMHVKNLLGPEENNCSPLDASQNTSDPLMHDSLEMSGVCTETETSGDCSEREVDTVSSSQVDSKPASQINDHANSCSFNAEDLAACQTTEYAKTYEGSGLSKVLGKGTPSWSHAGIPLENQPCCLEESNKNAGHRSELLPDRTVVTADDSIGNDCLEDVERPDVMTEETSQEWEKRLEFLLESDDEDELKLGKECDGCAYFLGKMPRLLQVSGDTVPMDATIGFFGHQSKSREVAVRAYRTSPPEMTLTVGQQQSKAPDIKEKEKYMQPVASTVIENDYPRIEEANSSGGQATENSSLVQSRSMDKETLGIKLSSCGLSGPSAAIEKQDADRTFSWGNSPKFERVREKTTKGKDKGNIGAPMKTSKYLLYKLRPKEANASEIRTIRRKSRCLDSAVLLHGCKSGQASQDTGNSSTHSGFLHGEGGEEYNSQEGKRMSSLSEGNQWPNQSAGLEPQDPEAETTGPIGDELKLFITEPELENGLDSTLSAQAKNISAAAEKTAWEEVTGNNGFQRDNATLGNSTDLNLSSPTHAVGQQEPCPSSQTLQVTMTGGTVSHHVLLEILSHTPSTSHQEGLCDILTVPDRQMKGGIAGRTEPHEINEVKTIDDSPCAGQLSGVDFQAALECSKPEAKESVLSLLHKQLRDLLYEEEEWDYDLTCAGREVKSLPAGSDSAKEAEELNRAGDVRTKHRPMPGHLTEDNQPVTKLATTPETVMEDGTDCNSRLKMDKTYSDTAMSKSSPALPGETAVVSLGAAFGPDTGKPSVHLVHGHLFTAEMYLEDNRRQTQSDNNGPVQTSVSQEGKAKRDNAFLPRAAESAFRFTEASNSPLECGQETVRDVPAYYSARLPCTERDVHCTGMSNEIPAENSHIIVSWPSIKDRARLNELPSKEDSSSNFSGKKADQFTSEGRFLVTAVDKSTEGKFKEKRTELDVNVQSDGNCGIYHVLTGDNSTDFQAIPDTGNYSYHVQEHNSVAAIAGWDRPEDTNIKGPGFEASYKGKFLSEVPLESNKEENAISQERSGCRTTAEQTAPESENILEILPPDSQQRISGGKPGIASAVCAVEKGMRTDITCLTPDSENAVAIVIGKECSSSGQDASNILGLVHTHKRNEEDENEGCSVKAMKTKSTLGENLMSAEPMQMEVERDMSKQTPGPGQDLSQRMEEERKTHVVPYERETGQTQIPISHDFEEAEVEPYMRALVDPKVQIYSWVDSMELQQIEHQKPKDEKQIPIPSRERNARKSQEPLECDLEGVEVEPYNRVLLNSKGIYSWHEGTDYVDPSRGRTEVSVEACVRTSTSHHQADAITTDVSNIPNMSEHTMEASVHIMPCTSENRPYSQKKFPSPLSDPPLKEERARLQETSKLCKASLAHRSPEGMKQNQDTVKKKVMPKVQSKKPRLDVKENTCNKVSCIKKVSKEETGQKDEKKEQRKPLSRKESKAPKLLKKIQAELFPDFSGNIKLCCQFVEIHDDATITWTKDSQLLARAHRSARDELPVSLAILQADKKDQGLYCCCLKNKYGKATADFNLTSEVLEHVASFQDAEGLEEIEFSQLMFREDFICDRYFSSSLHGRITTEELHFGEGVHRKAFRSKVMQGLVPMFSPGHPCVLKVHNAISHGTKTNDELVKRNYKLALQECCVQNTAREYAKIYAAETKLLEDFGEVPEIIPIFLIHRPQSNVPYATVEEELIGEFVKYSIRDGKEINFKRRDSEAGQKCCTFQHWVYERTNGGLLITDMQGVGMKLTDVGIATLAKGYKGFKGNCSISFIDQFKALHQCNKYCEMLGLKPLQTSHQKQKKPVLPKSKTQQPSSSTLKKTVVGAQAAKKT